MPGPRAAQLPFESPGSSTLATWADEAILLRYTRRVNLAPILLGTSSFTASGWAGSSWSTSAMPPVTEQIRKFGGPLRRCAAQ